MDTRVQQKIQEESKKIQDKMLKIKVTAQALKK